MHSTDCQDGGWQFGWDCSLLTSAAVRIMICGIGVVLLLLGVGIC